MRAESEVEMTTDKAILIMRGIQSILASRHEEDKEAVLAIQAGINALKAQEPVEPKKLMEKSKNGYRWRFYCGKCGDEIDRLDKYCRHCGRPVKWE